MIKLLDVELSQRFLGSKHDLTLLEADAILIGLNEPQKRPTGLLTYRKPTNQQKKIFVKWMLRLNFIQSAKHLNKYSFAPQIYLLSLRAKIYSFPTSIAKMTFLHSTFWLEQISFSGQKLNWFWQNRCHSIEKSFTPEVENLVRIGPVVQKLWTAKLKIPFLSDFRVNQSSVNFK